MAEAAVPAGAGAVPVRGTLRAVLAAVRPGEWVKNGFVLAPLVFSGQLDDAGAAADAVAATAAFCAVASAGYLVNDLLDADLDRQHPLKRTRPVAAGQLTSSTAAALAATLLAAGVTLAALAGAETVLYVLGYTALSAAYSLGLKRLVIIDVMAIAAGFLIRVTAGVAAVDAPHSDWLIVCTGALAMFLGFTKRRQEAASELHLGLQSRPVLEHYSLPFLDQMVTVVTAGTAISYVIYTVNSPLIGSRMLPTAAPVVYGLFRYLYLIYHRNDPRDTATLVREDPGMVGAGLAWIVLAVVLLYA